MITITHTHADGTLIEGSSDEHYPRPWPYDEVRGRKSAEEMAAILAEVERREQKQEAAK